MEKIKLPEDGSVTDALKRLHQAQIEWLVISYAPGTKNQLAVVGEGMGGLTEARVHFENTKDAAYCLLVKQHQVELARTTKFAFVNWCPDNLPPMRKALVTTHKGQVTDLLKPFHVTLECAGPKDLDEDEIMDKIGFSSGTKKHETDKSVYANKPTAFQAGSTLGKNAVKDLAPKEALSTGGGGVLTIFEEEKLRDAIKAVRNDNDPTDWVLVHYKDKKTLEYHSSGQGGLEEFCAHLNDDEVWYGLFRINEKIDNSVTVKFGFLKLMSQKLPALTKASISTHRGFVNAIFSPNHMEFDVGGTDEFNPEIAIDKIGAYTGTKNLVTDKIESKLKSMEVVHKEVKHHAPAVESDAKVSLDFEDEDAFRQAIKDVRNDKADVRWMLGVYKDKKLSLAGKGEDEGVEAMLELIDQSEAAFGLIRVNDVIDKSVTVKFVYIRYQPVKLAPMKKAYVSTRLGLLNKVFEPYQVDFFTEDLGEITTQVVKDKVGYYSGSKSNVTEKESLKTFGGV